jgi:tRNA 2-selenouridine synthase
VFIESESKKVGNVAVPTSLIEAMRASPCLNLVLPDAERVALLLEDYVFFVRDTEHFCQRLQVLAEFRGKVVVDAWIASVRAGDIAPVVQELLTQHYDPVYIQSMQRNFALYAVAPLIEPHDHSELAMANLATALLKYPQSVDWVQDSAGVSDAGASASVDASPSAFSSSGPSPTLRSALCLSFSSFFFFLASSF